MVGSALSLYFHIPFCTRKCPYCHFYVVPNNLSHHEILLTSLLTEWKRLLPKTWAHEITSIYFGGGTPSLFGCKPIAKLLSTIERESLVASDCEITLEANPEDVTTKLMREYRDAGINRVSIGVQSLVDSSLTVLERRHSAQRAFDAVVDTFLAGIKNLSIDLMFELPDQTPESFAKSLHKLKDLPITHLSLYNLTIEPNTPFSKRTLNLPSQQEGLAMLEQATSHLESIGLYRYEISAFAKPGFASRHNMGYWTQRPFFGLGPSAFSFYEGSRFRNIAHLSRYAKALRNNQSPVDFSELLPYPQNQLEQLAVELRLIRGVDLSRYSLPEATHEVLKDLKKQGLLCHKQQHLKLTKKGLLFYDLVASEII